MKNTDPNKMNKDELEHFIQQVVEDFPHENGYPSNIIDHVFFAIEQNTIHIARYHRAVRDTPNGKHTVNPWIGKLVKRYTGMETELASIPAKLSSLIETYTELK